MAELKALRKCSKDNKYFLTDSSGGKNGNNYENFEDNKRFYIIANRR